MGPPRPRPRRRARDAGRARAAGEATRLGLPDDDDFGGFRVIATAAARGDAGATTLIEESAELLASGVLTLANLFDLDSVSLAGPAFAVAGPTYVRAISRRLERDFFVRTKHGIRVRVPRPGLCTDNGAMVAALGSEMVARGRTPSAIDLPADSSMPVELVLA